MDKKYRILRRIVRQLKQNELLANARDVAIAHLWRTRLDSTESDLEAVRSKKQSESSKPIGCPIYRTLELHSWSLGLRAKAADYTLMSSTAIVRQNMLSHLRRFLYHPEPKLGDVNVKLGRRSDRI